MKGWHIDTCVGNDTTIWEYNLQHCIKGMKYRYMFGNDNTIWEYNLQHCNKGMKYRYIYWALLIKEWKNMVKILAINKNHAIPSVCDNQINHQEDLK